MPRYRPNLSQLVIPNPTYILKNLTILILIVVTGCKQPTKRTVNKDRTSASISILPKTKKDTLVKKIYPLTDSGQLMLHLDSLPKYSFAAQPNGENYQNSDEISLAVFKRKKLFNLPIKLIPTVLGAGFLDHYEDLREDGTMPDSIAASFNLVNDSVTYKMDGTLVATTPKFVVINAGSVLLTMSYHLDVIDAIHSWAGAGNNHWQIGRTTTIDKDLTIILHHSWSVETDRKGHFEEEYADENWFIDNDGHIKKQPKKHKTKKHK